MRSLAATLFALTVLAAPALAADGDAAPAPPAPDAAAPDTDTPADDATFDAQFQCPEALPSNDDRIDEFQHYIAWAKRAHPDWSLRKRMDVRYGLLRRHGCATTIANIAGAAKPPFAP
jgi:hypothetical protein